ncbi:MAG: OmpA family protein [Pseudomonadales bacterium]|jgi:chemotaxis protein MotB|nr:OmpA family protein [Pseudomonadales bacterium]
MRRRYIEAENDTDRWMVSYADFITLLFAFFVVMYAISSVNDEKYRVLSATLSETFAVDSASLDPVQVGEPDKAASPHVVDLPESTAFADQEDGDTFIEDPIDAAQSLLGGFAQLEGVSVASNNEWLELSLDANVLFAPGQTSLTPVAAALLEPAVALVSSTRNPLTIEGFTDNVPSESQLYPSNWEISSARASSVARFFVSQGVRPERISAVGYGENFPVATNATPDGRAANRRVVVVIARRTDASRNLNANPEGGAFAFLRSGPQNELDPRVVKTRTPEGGLIFSTESDLLSRDDE